MNWLWEKKNKKVMSVMDTERELKRALFYSIDAYVDNQRCFRSGNDRGVRVGFGPAHIMLEELFPCGVPIVPDDLYHHTALRAQQCGEDSRSILRCLLQELRPDGVHVLENVRLREPGIREDRYSFMADFCRTADNRALLESVMVPISIYSIEEIDGEATTVGDELLIASAVLVMKYRLEHSHDILRPHKEFFFGFSGESLAVGVVKVENGKIFANLAIDSDMCPCLGDLQASADQSLVIRVLYGLLHATPQQLGWIIPGECARVQGLDLRAILGCGGFCTVYCAVTAGGEDVFALKAAKFSLDEEDKDFTLAHIRTELSALQTLVRGGHCKHVPALSSIQSPTRAWVGYRDIGEPLSAHLSRLADAQRVEFAKGRFYQSLLAAVRHAHRCGVVHNDIRPVNILMVTQYDRPVLQLIDWGCATAPGALLNVPHNYVYTYHEDFLLATQALMRNPSAHIGLRSAAEHDLASVAYCTLTVVLYDEEMGFSNMPGSGLCALELAAVRQDCLDRENIVVPEVTLC